jgi:hypothetical protein
MPDSPAFAALRQRLEERHRDAAAAVFTSDQTLVLSTGLGDLARALGGGFPRGAISTVEGDPSSAAARSRRASSPLRPNTAWRP